MGKLSGIKSAVRVVTQALHIYDPLYSFYAKLKWKGQQKKFFGEFDALLEEIRQRGAAAPKGKKVIFTGILESPKKPTFFPFCEEVQKKLGDVEFVYLDEQEAPAAGQERRSHHYMPRAIRRAGYDSYLECVLTPEMEKDLAGDPFLTQMAEYLHKRQGKNMVLSYAKALVWYYWKTYRTAMEAYRPEAVVIWSKFPALHLVCDHACKQMGVTPLFMEYGSLPGTFALDTIGQMGESEPSRDFERFRELPVTEEELYQAGEVLEYLRESRLNRNAQTVQTDELTMLNKRLKKNRPLVLLAGQNDFDSGLLPYDEAARANHSPMFRDSYAAMLHMAKLASKYKFNLVYKPHPAMVDKVKKLKLPPNVIKVLRTDINLIIDMADVVVTIVSQTGYVSSIRGKTTLTLGYNQLRGKGATYEAYTLEDIPHALRMALRHGVTEEMHDKFVLHTAQMLRYNLYDDMADRSLRFGQTTDDAADFFRRNCRPMAK